MDIDGIKTLVAISRFGGFTRAATHLNRSQPAISRRIGLMEAELGAPLIERVRGGVKLTDAGMAFLPFAEAALAAVEDGLNAVRASTGVDSGFVSVALVGTLADTPGRHAHRRHPPPVRPSLQDSGPGFAHGDQPGGQ